MVLLHHLFHVEANSWQWAFGFDLQRARVGTKYLLRSLMLTPSPSAQLSSVGLLI